MGLTPLRSGWRQRSPIAPFRPMDALQESHRGATTSDRNRLPPGGWRCCTRQARADLDVARALGSTGWLPAMRAVPGPGALLRLAPEHGEGSGAAAFVAVSRLATHARHLAAPVVGLPTSGGSLVSEATAAPGWLWGKRRAGWSFRSGYGSRAHSADPTATAHTVCVASRVTPHAGAYAARLSHLVRV